MEYKLIDRAGKRSLDFPEQLRDGLLKCFIRNRSTFRGHNGLASKVCGTRILSVSVYEIREIERLAFWYIDRRYVGELSSSI
jgi:hypothetical protein